jgi:3-methyladenine DNA glycosylase AlkD
MDITKIVRQDLKANADERTKISGQRFFKEPVKIYGVKTPVARKLAKQHFATVKGLPKNNVFRLCETFWQSGYTEEAFVACEWVARFHRQLEPADFPLLERWIDEYITNWATCDTFCNHTVGTFLEMYPKFIKELKRWAKSENLWKRRAAAVSLIMPARKGLFHKEIFELARILLLDSEDLVQKGYGWMLKSASQFDEPAVFEFVITHKAKMPRTALRYAIEKMPKELKSKAMS